MDIAGKYKGGLLQNASPKLSSAKEGAVLFSQVFATGNKTLLLGEVETVYGFAMRLALALGNGRPMMHGWQPLSPIYYPILFCAPQPNSNLLSAEYKRLEKKIINQQVELLSTSPQLPRSPVFKYASSYDEVVFHLQDWLFLSNLLSTIIMDCSCFPKLEEISSCINKFRDRFANCIVVLLNSSRKEIPRYKWPVDTVFSFKRYDFDNGKDFIESSIRSRLFKRHRIFFSLDNLTDSPHFCIYGERKSKGTHKKLSPETIHAIVEARTDRYNMVTIKLLAQRYGVSVATLNRIIKYNGLAKLASPDGKKRGRKAQITNYPIEELAQSASITMNYTNPPASSSLVQVNANHFSTKPKDTVPIPPPELKSDNAPPNATDNVDTSASSSSPQ